MCCGVGTQMWLSLDAICLYTHLMKPVGVVCIYNGCMCPYMGPFVLCVYSDTCTLGYSLSMYCVGQKVHLGVFP